MIWKGDPMKVTSIRFAVLLLTLALLTAGCTWGRRSAKPPHEEISQARLSTDLQSMRLENEALRRQQHETEKRLEDLRTLLVRSQEEQRRFRESMATNFDLLEQSVALTLSKSITADLNARPANPAAPARSTASPVRPKSKRVSSGPMAKAKAGNQHSGGSVASRSADQAPALKRNGQAESAPGTAPGSNQRPGMPHPTLVKASLGMPLAGNRPRSGAMLVSDPDLTPPVSPIKLVPHRSAKALYEKGFALFARRKFNQSITVFQNFLERYPNDIYSDNAQFWIGESYLRTKRPEEAEDAYRKVLRTYEHRSTLEGYKTPDAIYRIGQGYRKRKQIAKARYYYQVLAERFPESSAGRKANRDLGVVGMATAAN